MIVRCKPRSFSASLLLILACAGGPAVPKDAESATVVAEPAGPNCPNGGVKVQVGAGAPSYVCNGPRGEAELTVTEVAAGTSCPSGGVLVEVGGVGTYVCNGAAGSGAASTSVTPEPPGANCANGGVRVQVGAGGPSFVCNGETGSPGAPGGTGATGEAGAPGAPGEAGAPGAPGAQGDAGAQGETGATGDTGPSGDPGAPGKTTLIIMNPEPPGVNCAAGGVRLDSGLDADADGQLQDGEITRTSYACNGLNVPLCVISKSIYGPGEIDPSNRCQVCAPDLSVSAFSPIGDGTACGDVFEGTCQGNVCVSMIYASSAKALVVDADDVYWAQADNDLLCITGTCVMKQPLQQGSTPVVLVSGQDRIFGLAALEGTLYWSNNSGSNAGVVSSCAASGCADAPTPVITGLNFPGYLAVGAGKIFVSTASPAALVSAPVAGGASSLVYSGPSSGARPQQVAIAGSTVYYAVNGSILAYPVNGGSQVVLASELNNPGGIAVSGGIVYFTELAGGAAGEGTIKQVSVAGGPVTTLASGQNTPTSLVTDGTSLYWTNTSSGQIMKMPVAGGTAPKVYARDQGTPKGLALRGNSVYWCGSSVAVGTPK